MKRAPAKSPSRIASGQPARGVQILVTGRTGKLCEAVAGALLPEGGSKIVTLPVGSQLLKRARARAVKALVFVLDQEEDLEPLRWVLQQNRSLPIVPVLSRRDAKLETLLRDEGLSEVIAAQDLTPAQLRRELANALAFLPPQRTRSPRRDRQPAELHAIRSALTAILGNAELALKGSRSSSQKHQLQEIVRGVAEIERTLRRLERAVPLSKP